MTTEDDKSVESLAEKIKSNLSISLNKMGEAEKISFLTQCLVDAETDKCRFISELEVLKKEKGKASLMERKLTAVQKMMNKTEMSKSTLEQLCRELNKSLKEEKEQNQQKLKLLRKTHDDTVNSFKKSLNEIQQSVQAKREQNAKVEEVERLSDNLNKLAEDYDTRLKELKQLYENRENDFKLIAKTKEDELGLLKRELEEVRKRITEVWQENIALKTKLLNSEEKVRLSMEAEITLRKTLEEYSGKYSKLLQSLGSSNESFDRVKKEMEKMNGNMIKLQAESRKGRNKLEDANQELAALRAENKSKDDALALKDRQLAQLQELCRRLQKKNGDTSRSLDNELADSDGKQSPANTENSKKPTRAAVESSCDTSQDNANVTPSTDEMRITSTTS